MNDTLNDDKIIKVASKSPTAAVAGAIAGTYRDHQAVEVQAIGAGAVNQAVKGVIQAKQFLLEEGKEIMFVPSFVDIELDGRTITAVRLSVEPKPTVPEEVMPVDTGAREGAAYLMSEETTIDQTAVPANADALTDKVDSYTTDEEIQEDFAERQKQAPSGRAQLTEQLEAHHAESPELSGGDLDAAWDQSDVGEETVGGTTPTPDQDQVDELGNALGITYEDDEPLDPDKVARRDEERWELNPESASDSE